MYISVLLNEIQMEKTNKTASRDDLAPHGI